MNMCGQFHIEKDDIIRLSKKYSLPKKVPIHDIKPVQPALVLLKDNESDIFQFGLSRKSLIINARCESIHEKKTFQRILHNRCIIPASYYYEYDSLKNKITFTNHEILYFAALYENHQFVILTTQANDSVKRIHDRMPLILNEDEVDFWLYEEKTDTLLSKIGPALENNQRIEQLSLF